MTTLQSIVLSTTIISLLSLIGVIALFFKEKLLNRLLLYLVAFSIGGLIGGAFFHLLPHALEKMNYLRTSFYLLVGFILFFVIEKYLYWRHCHKSKCDIHAFSYLNLVGDSVHNFIDGIIIAGSFLTGWAVGISASIAIALHEIPQEIGDFSILVYGGFSKVKALLLNLAVALTALAGGVVGYYLIAPAQSLLGPLMAIASGGFLYISLVDLVPQLKKDSSSSQFISYLLVMAVGLSLLYLVKFI